ncbi:MAG: type 4a pilus biogenesis protein PilO [Gammaproteobacteria bacterium]|nr:type 4a pilus biogenesis protein PilO [Gammaproteobacteria bacterium]
MEHLLNQLDGRQLKLIAACGAIVLIAAIVNYGFWPKIQELGALRESRAVMTQVTATQVSAEAEIARLDDEVKTLSHRLQGDMANLPVRQMEAFIIGRLQNISWRNDITLVGVEPAIGESVEMYREVLFRVELSGDYFSLLDWLGDVSSELGFVVIKEYQLSVADIDPQDPLLTTKLLLAAYRVMDS